MKLTNTLTGQKEEFAPLHPPQVTLYVCGVTVYDETHIGHARGAVVFDVLRRLLSFKGYEATFVRNITDIDDKIIDQARRGHNKSIVSPDLKTRAQAIAEFYTQRFQEDFSRLGLLVPTHEPKATEYIPQMIRFIELLQKRGMAYEGADGVYFSVRTYAQSARETSNPYGQLSHQELDEMRQGVRAEPAQPKRDPLDFALWKKAKPEEPSWDSPWGAGRPGWHIECSTMATALLGDAFDIHGGGADLIFPHHENEIAQARGAGKPFARVWLHNGLLTVNGQKMSKSLGNFVTIPQVLERHSPEVLRLFYLEAHYRSPLDFSWERLEETAHAYDRLSGFLAQVDQRIPWGKREQTDETEAAERKFTEAMEDDLNTPQALSALYELVAKAAAWWNIADAPARLQQAADTLRRLSSVLGFRFQESIPEEAQELIDKRDQARGRKDFSTADQIRRQLIEQGYIVEDTGGKTVVRRRA